MPDITLYENGPTRSARVRWALLETGQDFTAVSGGKEVFSSPELAKAHPLRKVPAATFDKKALFESAALTNYIADISPDANLIAPSGTWSRALHDQWVMFAFTEMEAWLWSSFLNTVLLPEEKKVPAICDQNASFFKRGAKALNQHLIDTDLIVEDRFTAADIIVGYTVNWGRRSNSLGDFGALQKYIDRLAERPHCTLNLS